MERWLGHKIDYNLMRSFGCAAYVHIREDKKGVRALKGVFLGYPYGVKGYKVLCLEKRREGLLINEDVVFYESDFPLLSKEKSDMKIGNSPLKTSEIVGYDEEDMMEDPCVQNLEVERSFDDDTSAKDLADCLSRRQTEKRGRRTRQELIDEAKEKLATSKSILARDRDRRSPKWVERFGFNNLLAYAFVVIDSRSKELGEHAEPSSFKEAIGCADAAK